jgi:hypothetical protein
MSKIWFISDFNMIDEKVPTKCQQILLALLARANKREKVPTLLSKHQIMILLAR